MKKISQKRIKNKELYSFLDKNILPSSIDNWNKGSLKTFNGILKLITGYDEDLEICFYSDKEFTFNTDKIYIGCLEEGDFIEEMPKIKIAHEDTTTTYEVLSIPQENETLISLDNETTKTNEKIIFRMFSKEYAYFTVSLENITYRITIFNPKENSEETFELPYEEDFKESLSLLKKNTNLDDIISLLEYHLGKLEKYPKIEVTRGVKDKNNLEKVTDEFILKDGHLDKYKQTKRVGSKSYTVKVQDDRISCNIENIKFDEEIKPDEELIKKGMQYVKKYPKN